MSLGTSEAIELEKRVSTFKDNLAHIEHADIMPLPDLTRQLQHNGKFFRIADENLRPGLYVDTGHHALRNLIDEPARLSFQLQPGRRIAREDSHNFVFFGGMWTEPAESPDGRVEVAVKLKDSEGMDKTDSILGELAAFQYLGKLALPTFRSAGLLVAEDNVSLLTHLDGPVYTMDTVDWPKLTEEERWDELMRPVDTMFMLHTNALFHCDLYFRNVGFYETGDTVIVDPELMVSARDDMGELVEAGMLLNGEQKRQLHQVKRLMAQDFSALCRSIEVNILAYLPKQSRPRNGEARLKLYRRHLYEPYKQLLSYSDKPEAKVLLRAYDEMMVDLKERARQDAI
jgi:hypothetical protein